MLKLSKLNDQPEIFHSIQGEGLNLGLPVVFIRLSLCNLYCIWCDTDYTWNWESTKFQHLNNKKYKKEDYLLKLENQEIVKEVCSFNCPNVVISGGEPLVQHKELTSLCKELKSNGIQHFEIETNGTLIPNDDLEVLIDQYNVSLKLNNSGVKEEDRIIPNAIQFFAQSPKSNFKFVVQKEDDLEEIENIILEYQINSNQVILMPEGRSEEELKVKRTWLIEICKIKNYRFSDRMHINVYGSKRGV